MSTPQFLTDEQAAAIWSGDTASILNFDKEPEPGQDTQQDKSDDNSDNSKDQVKKLPISDEDLSNVWANDVAGEESDEEDDDDKSADDDKDKNPAQVTDDQKSTNAGTTTSSEPKKSGRKPSDLVNMVNQLVEEELLFGYESGEVKTIEEAKELIKENLKYKEESTIEKAWQEKVKTYSPQVRAILNYAENGGSDITPLLQAISDVEKSAELSVEEESGQEEIVRQVLKIKGFDDEEIKDQIDTLKDLDRLKKKAEKFLPELNKMKEQRIQIMLQEQEAREAQAREAAQIYLETVQNTLDKEVVGPVKLQKEDKYKIIQALAEDNYRSISGYKVNEFVKVLEELQFGKNANYEHFLNIVHFAIDKDGFIERIKDSIKTEVTGDTIKKLKTAKTSNPNSNQGYNPDTNPKKNVIPRSGFKNPYAK